MGRLVRGEDEKGQKEKMERRHEERMKKRQVH
jgi:hypothetical protein